MAKRVALLIENEFNDEEVAVLGALLRGAGVDVTLVAPYTGRPYTGRNGTVVTSEMDAVAARAAGFDGIIIPGGYSPDRLRMRHAMLDLVRDAVAAGHTVGAISHGAQVLISAGVIRGRSVTCWPSIAIDVMNAGALYVDRPVVEDGGIITSRKQIDVPQFAVAIVRAIGL